MTREKSRSHIINVGEWFLQKVRNTRQIELVVHQY